MAAKKSSAGRTDADYAASNRATTVVGEAVAPAAPAPAQNDEQMAREVSELKDLVRSLAEAVEDARARSSQNAAFQSTVAEIKQIARALPVAAAYGVAVQPAPAKEGCHDGCECVECACCTFEIWMSHVRADQMQLPIEPLDSNIVPTSVMEIWMFASIDPVNNIGACIPDPSPLSYIPLHKQITDPVGPWVQVNRCIGTAMVKKGVPYQCKIAVSGVEREDDLERLIPGNRDEWGSGNAEITLDCCYSSYSPIDIPIPLTSWGQGGGQISARFIVVKRC
jgi:hypothetical protein